MLLNVLQCTAQPLGQRVIRSQMPLVPRLGNKSAGMLRVSKRKLPGRERPALGLCTTLLMAFIETEWTPGSCACRPGAPHSGCRARRPAELQGAGPSPHGSAHLSLPPSAPSSETAVADPRSRGPPCPSWLVPKEASVLTRTRRGSVALPQHKRLRARSRRRRHS